MTVEPAPTDLAASDDPFFRAEFAPLAPRRTLQRVGASMITSVVRAAASFAAALIAARALGPHDYGNFTFLMASFASVGILLDFGSSQAFFTLLSIRPRGKQFFEVYAFWTLGVQLLGTGALLTLAPDRFLQRGWVDQPRTILLIAFAASFLSSQVWTSVIQVGESQRRTLRVQMAGAIQSVVHAIVLVVLVAFGRLTVRALLILLGAEYTLLTLLMLPGLLRSSIAAADTETTPNVVLQFVRYCRPVAVYAMVGFVYAFADRWLLQHFAGAAQQGIFGVAQQFGALSLLATASLLNVFWKEIAEAQARGDEARVKAFYINSRRALFFTATWMSCLLIPWSAQILALTVGQQYAAGAQVLALMLLYPIHQAIGQLQGTFFFATGQTRVYSTLGLLHMGISLPVAYFLLANTSAQVPGLGLGAIGLAAKLVGLQLIQVLVGGIVIARKWRCGYDLGQQFTLVAVLLLLSFATRWLVLFVLPNAGALWQILAAAGMYGAVTAALVWRFPAIVGVTRVLAMGVLNKILLRHSR